MTKARNAKQYNISKHRFLELYHFCCQYPEWKEQLKNMTDTMRGSDPSKEMSAGSGGSATERLALKRATLRERCELIEQTAIEADAELYQYIIEGVTCDYATFRYLKDVRKMPCEKDMYYKARKKFYYILSRKL